MIVLALAGASLLALAVQAGRWWTIEGITIGPLSSSRCFSGDCRRVDLSWVPDASSLWLRSGIATYAAGLCAAALLVIVAGALAARRLPRRLAGSALVATLTATLTGAAFVALYPGLPGDAIGRGILFHFAGVAAAIAATVSVLRLRT